MFDDVRISYKNDKYIFKCLKCNSEYPISYENKMYKCPKCNMGIKPRGMINSINNYIKSLNLSSKLDEMVLPGYNVDIFIENKNVAIDVLSVYTHSNTNQNNNSDKVDFFTKNGYTLISIMEDDWYNHQDAVKSKIKRLYLKICTVHRFTGDLLRELGQDIVHPLKIRSLGFLIKNATNFS